MKRISRGFTLAELLIVVAIIAVLVAIAIPILNKKLEKSREAHDIYTMRQAASLAVELYYDGVQDEASAKAAGLAWWDKDRTADQINAAGAYDPGTGTLHPDRTKFKPYGKGTTIDGGTQFVLGNSRGAYASKEDYTKAVVMVSIYPKGNKRHIDVYWKNNTKESPYIGGQNAKDDPKYSIRIPID